MTIRLLPWVFSKPFQSQRTKGERGLQISPHYSYFRNMWWSARIKDWTLVQQTVWCKDDPGKWITFHWVRWSLGWMSSLLTAGGTLHQLGIPCVQRSFSAFPKNPYKNPHKPIQTTLYQADYLFSCCKVAFMLVLEERKKHRDRTFPLRHIGKACPAKIY